VILAATINYAGDLTETIAMTPIRGSTRVSSPSRLPRVDWGGRDIDKDITTKNWIILAASNHAEDLTGTITVASTQRYYDSVTVINAAARQLGWER
jgi:hypothetical protein